MFDTDIAPSEWPAEVTYLGNMDSVNPEFNEDNWDHIGSVKAERTMGAYKHDHDSDEWHYSTEITKEVNPIQEGFWMWGDRLVRVVAATILESNLLVFKRKDDSHAETPTTG